MAATIIGASTVYLDGTVVTVALPQIQRDFHASVSGLQWLVDIYLLFLTVPILVAGSLSDRYGCKKLFNIGPVGFTLASVVCGAATNLNQLILARVFQGIAGAIMLPGSLAILNATFPSEVRGQTVGIWSAFTPLATAIGPLLGGAEAPPALTPDIDTRVEIAIDQAFVDAFRVMMGLCGALALLSAGISVATINNQFGRRQKKTLLWSDSEANIPGPREIGGS